MQKNVQYHHETRDPSYPRDFIDEYLHVLEDSPTEQKPDPSFSGYSPGKLSQKCSMKFTPNDSLIRLLVDQLVSICMDLFGAGAESTSNSIAFAMLYMVLYPEVQDRVRKEIEATIGKHTLVSYADRKK